MNKFIFLALFVAFASIQAHATSIDLKCEEGVGNVYNPAQYLHISGDLNIQSQGELDLNQKNKLKVQVPQNDQMTQLSSNEYRASLKTENGLYLTLTTADGRQIIVSMFSDIPQVLVKVIDGKTLILRKDKVTGSGVCWGGNPILTRD